MLRFSTRALASASIAVTLTACGSEINAPDESSLVASAFSTSPTGFSELTSSYEAGAGGDSAWAPPGRRGGPGGGPGRGTGSDMHGPGRSGFMGGGLDGAFFGANLGTGGRPHGRGHERGPFSSGVDPTCTFAGGDVTCTGSRNGLAVTRILSFRTAAGTPQQRPDSTTDSERVRVAVSGTTTHSRRADSVVTTVQHASDRTVTGLAATSAARTVNGTSSGSEDASGRNRDGAAFTARRTSGDTVTGLVIPRPASANSRPYPIAGAVIRSMTVTMTLQGGTATTSTRREVITYDGSAMAKVVITENGTSRTCTMPLPRGRLACS